MMKEKNKQKGTTKKLKFEFKHFLLAEVIIAIVIISILLVSITIGDDGYVEYCKLKIKINKKHSEIQKLAMKNYKLNKTIQLLKNEDPFLLEKISREKLMLIKPGEVVYLIQPLD